jgi:hypothetical protein
MVDEIKIVDCKGQVDEYQKRVECKQDAKEFHICIKSNCQKRSTVSSVQEMQNGVEVQKPSFVVLMS